MVSVTICIGSNCGDRKNYVLNAVEWLKEILIQTKSSSVYETPCALKSDKNYYNAVVTGYYQSIGEDLDMILKDKEREMGRDSQCRHLGLVPIDMDIVILNGEIVKPWDYKQKFFKIGYSQIS